MKAYKISESLTVQMAEHLGDIPIKRWTEIKKWALVVQTGTDIPSLRKYGEDFARAFDNQSLAQMYQTHYNWLYKLSILDRGDDADQYIFALITFEENEDVTKYDPAFILAKLERYGKAKLNQQQVKEEVENFIRGVLKF